MQNRSALMGVKEDAVGAEDILDLIVTPSQKENGQKKRGRPRTIPRENIKGFSDAEIRR